MYIRPVRPVLQLYKHPALIDGGRTAHRTEVGDHRLNMRAARHDFGDTALHLGHAVNRGAARAFGVHRQQAGILNGEEALGDDHRHVASSAHRGEEDHPDHQLEAQRIAQRPIIGFFDRDEAGFEKPVDRAGLGMRRHPAGHQGRQC